MATNLIEGSIAGDEPTCPGAILRKEVMERSSLSQTDFADTLGVSKVLVFRLLNGEAKITPSLALRLGKVTATEPRYWLDLQWSYSLLQKSRKLGSVISGLAVLPQNEALEDRRPSALSMRQD